MQEQTFLYAFLYNTMMLSQPYARTEKHTTWFWMQSGVLLERLTKGQHSSS